MISQITLGSVINENDYLVLICKELVGTKLHLYLLIRAGLDADFRWWVIDEERSGNIGNCLLGRWATKQLAIDAAFKYKSYLTFSCSSLLEVGLMAEIISAKDGWDKSQYECIAKALEGAETTIKLLGDR